MIWCASVKQIKWDKSLSFSYHIYWYYIVQGMFKCSVVQLSLLTGSNWCWPQRLRPKDSFSCMHSLSLCPTQLLGRGECTHNALCYCECMLFIHCELLNHLLTTAWRELRQWLVNTLEWMKGLGIKWQDVLKEEQVVVEERADKPRKRGTSCISMWTFLGVLVVLMLCWYRSRYFTLVLWYLFLLISPLLSISSSLCALSLLSTLTQPEKPAP